MSARIIDNYCGESLSGSIQQFVSRQFDEQCNIADVPQLRQQLPVEHAQEQFRQPLHPHVLKILDDSNKQHAADIIDQASQRVDAKQIEENLELKVNRLD